jgi:two-component system, chemotaxis family, chemotaxis protein CheY
MNVPGVLSVGQCGFDHTRISRFLLESFGATTVASDTADNALAAVRSGSFELILVNRVFDRDGYLGLELIRSLKGDPALAGIPVILVSNYADAQAEAVALGALPGFGKGDLSSAKARETLDPILKLAESR